MLCLIGPHQDLKQAPALYLLLRLSPMHSSCPWFRCVSKPGLRFGGGGNRVPTEKGSDHAAHSCCHEFISIVWWHERCKSWKRRDHCSELLAAKPLLPFPAKLCNWESVCIETSTESEFLTPFTPSGACNVVSFSHHDPPSVLVPFTLSAPGIKVSFTLQLRKIWHFSHRWVCDLRVTSAISTGNSKWGGVVISAGRWRQPLEHRARICCTTSFATHLLCNNPSL